MQNLRRITLFIIIFISLSQLMSYNVTDVAENGKNYQVDTEKTKNTDNSIKFKSETTTISGKILRATLENGLEVIIQELADTDVVAARAYVKVGGIYEGKNLGHGISHYCEHLVSGGTTAKRSEKESAELVRSIGGNSNAYTTYNHTCYHITTMNNYAETAIDLLGDWLSGCLIEESEFNREKGVIIREVDKGETEPSRIFSKFTFSKLFTNTPMSVPVIGYPSLVKKVTHEQMKDFYTKFYCPNNTVLSIAGGIDANETLEQIVKYWAKWERKPLEFPSIPEVKGQSVSKQACLASDLLKGNTAQLRISYHTVPMQNSDMFPLDVLSEILTGSENSPLQKILKNDKHIVNSVNSYSWTPGFGFGQFTISADTTYDKLAEVKNIILNEIEILKDVKIQEQDIIKAKKRIRGDYINELQGAEAHAKSNASNLILNLSSDYDEKYLARIDNVTADEIMLVVKKYLGKNQNNTFAFYSKDAAALDKDGNPFEIIEIKDIEDAKPSKTCEFFTLYNGMRFILKKTPGTKSAAIAAFGNGGLRYETEENNGIFRIMSMLMKKGSKKFSADKISEIFSDIGGKITCSSGNNTLSVQANLVTGGKNLENALSVINDVLRNPKFEEKEFEQTKKTLNYAIQRRDEDWQDEAIWLMRKQFFGKHPYSMYVNGSEKSLSKITLEQVKSLHAEYVTSNNLVFSIVGDFDLSIAMRIIRGIFGDWEKPSTKIGVEQKFVLREKTEQFSEKSKKKQTTICIGYNAPKLTNRQDVLKMRLLDAVISGIYLPSGWLHEALRGGDQKYVYYIHAMGFYGQDAGMFYVLTQCNPEDKVKVLEIIRKQMQRTWTEKIDEKVLETAKRIYFTNQAISQESNEDKAVEYTLDELYGLGWNNEKEDSDIVDKITVEDLMAVAEKYLKNNELLITIEP